MTSEDFKTSFLRAAREWVCDGYSLDVRYIARRAGDGAEIWQALVGFTPLPTKVDNSFEVRAINFVVGQFQQRRGRLELFHQLLEQASEGELRLPRRRMALRKEREHDYYSEMSNRERWFSELHLQISGSSVPNPNSSELAATDDELRLVTPPFDGLADAARWLGLTPPGYTLAAPMITMRVNPPCDLIMGDSTLANDRLTITLLAHQKFDVDRVGLAINSVPSDTLGGRQQIADAVKWHRARGGVRRGVAKIEVRKADGVLAMLVIGKSTVRRHWFVDPAKARNNRFLAVQHFDKELKMVRHGALEATDSSTFERAVAALFFLSGFSPCIQLERDAPDLVVTTPGGRLVLVECTTRTSDFASKLGKLVDRRGALIKSLQGAGHPAPVAAVLVCQLPRDQIAATAEELRLRNAILLTRENLHEAFERLRNPSDPDKLLEDALAQAAIPVVQRTRE